MRTNTFPLVAVALCALGCGLGALGCSDEGTGADGGSGGSAGSSADAAPEPFPAPVPDDCIQDVTPGFQQIVCDEIQFDLAVPGVCLQEACGLIFDVHGFGMNGELENLHTNMQQLGNGAGYIVVQPNAPGMVPATSWSEEHDAIVFAFMERVIAAYHVDDSRVHFGGYSQGGFMTWRFICAHADVIASAAPIAAGQQAGDCQISASPREVDIFYTHGTTDGLVNFSGAPPKRDAVISAYGLAQSEVVQTSAEHEWTRYDNDDGTVFEFVQHDWETDFALGMTPLAGHCFPGSDEFLGCGASNPFNWGETVLQFYMDHPRQ